LLLVNDLSPAPPLVNDLSPAPPQRSRRWQLQAAELIGRLHAVTEGRVDFE
jgi:hypothetical protein